MTIASTTVATSGSLGNGATTVFNFSFSVETYGAVTQASQIQVIQETVASGAETVLTLTTHYTASFNADQNANPGGSITMVSAPSSAYRIWIRLNPSFLQATDYQNQGGFLMETVEDQADQQARQINVLADRIRRAPRAGIQAGPSFDGEITGDVTPGYLIQINSWGTGYTQVANNGSSNLVTATGAGTAQTLADWVAQLLSPGELDSIAALQAKVWTYGRPAEVQLKINYFSNDGGGLFWYDSTDTTTADDGFMTIVDASGNRWKRQYWGLVDARWAGMRGNGSTDNTAAFARIINWARATANTYKALKLFVPRGQYAFTSAMLLEPPSAAQPMLANLHLIGEGSWHTDQGTEFLFTGSASPVARLMIIRSVVHMTITDIRLHTAVAGLPRLLQIDTKGASGTYYSSFNIHFVRCRFTGTNGFINDVVQLSNCSTVKFTDCDFAPTTSTVAMRIGTRASTAAITGITQANPGVITAVAHKLRIGDDVVFASVGGMTQLNGNTYYVNTVPSVDTFTICDSAGVAINTTGFGAYTAGGTVQIASNVGSFGGGTASQIVFEECLWRGDIEHCQGDNLYHRNSTFSTTGPSEIPVKITPVGDQDIENVTLDNCFCGFGSSANGDFYTQGTSEKGLIVRGGVYGKDHPNVFNLATGYATFDAVHFRTTILSTQVGIAIGANAVAVRIDPSCYNDGVGKLYSDARAIQPATFPASVVQNGSFDVWDDRTTLSPTTVDFIAVRWKARRGSNAAGGTWSRQTGFLGAEYCMRVSRDNGNAGTEQLFVGHQIETIDVRRLAGQKVRLVVAARKGANYSHATSVLPCTIYTGTGTDEAGNLGSGFATGNASTVLTAQTIGTTEDWLVYNEYTIPSTATEMMLVFSFTPTGTAGAADHFEITHVDFVPSESVAMINRRRRPSIAETRAACERFYEKSFALATTPAQNVGAGTGEALFNVLVAAATAQRSPTIPFRTRKRATPTLTLYNPAAANAQVRDLTAAGDTTATATTNISTLGFGVTCTGNAGGAVGGSLGVHWQADARL